MDDHIGFAKVVESAHTVVIGNVDFVKDKSVIFTQPIKAHRFEARQIIVIEIVNADDAETTREQRVRNVRANKPGGAGDNDGGFVRVHDLRHEPGSVAEAGDLFFLRTQPQLQNDQRPQLVNRKAPRLLLMANHRRQSRWVKQR